MSAKRIAVAGLIVVVWLGLLGAEEISVRTRSGIKIKGKLQSVSDRGIVLIWAKKKKEFRWDQLSPRSAYDLKKERVAADDARGHLELGRFCAENDLPKLAKQEFDTALRLDPSLKGDVASAMAVLEGASVEKPDPTPMPPKTKPRTAPETAEAEEAPKTATPKAVDPPPKKKPAGKPLDADALVKALKLPYLVQVSDPELLVKMLSDPQGQQAEWVKLQHRHLNAVTEKLCFKFFTHETDHYILHSTMSSTVSKRVGHGCEDLYKKMSKAFDVQKDDMLWWGKCIVYLFDTRAQFLDFAAEIEGFDASNAGGYFAPRGRMVYIAIPRGRQGAKGFESTLIHEGAHAFLQLFREDIRIKPWIHEGVAQYFENKCFPKDPEWAMKRSLVRAGNDLSLRQIRRPDSYNFSNAYTMQLYYSYAWTALDFMIRANPKKFVKFLHELKAGKSEDEAIQAAFGKSMRDFEKAWVRYVHSSF